MSEIRKFSKLNQIRNQAIGNAQLLGEEKGKALITAYAKAYEEICKNPTIKFDGKVLTFVSRTSGETRNVTAYGCSDLCVCKNIPTTYHRALYELISKYYGVSSENKSPFHTYETWQGGRRVTVEKFGSITI